MPEHEETLYESSQRRGRRVTIWYAALNNDYVYNLNDALSEYDACMVKTAGYSLSFYHNYDVCVSVHVRACVRAL